MPEYPGELHWTWKTTGHSSMVSETFQVLNAFRIPGTGNHEEHGYHEFIHDPGNNVEYGSRHTLFNEACLKIISL
jgi:hypothetical protein